jgi:hypothetical protein
MVGLRLNDVASRRTGGRLGERRWSWWWTTMASKFTWYAVPIEIGGGDDDDGELC